MVYLCPVEFSESAPLVTPTWIDLLKQTSSEESTYVHRSTHPLIDNGVKTITTEIE